MKKNIKEEIILASVIIGAFVSYTLGLYLVKSYAYQIDNKISSDYPIVLTNSKRSLCNNQILYPKGKLMTEDNFYFDIYSDKKDSPDVKIKNLENRLLETNKEVNNLRALIGCYFDQ